MQVIQSAIGAAMEQQDQTFPWRCPCGSLNSKRAVHCPICALHWSKGTPHSNTPKHAPVQYRQQKWAHPRSQKQKQGWQQEYQYEEESQWVKSPRRQGSRPRSGSRSKQGKGRGKGKQKGFHQLGGPAGSQNVMEPSGPPAVMPTYQEAPWLMAPPPPLPTGSMQQDPNAAAVAATASAAEAKLRSVYALLEKHPEGLHPDIQKEIKEAKLREGEIAIKSLHKQVNALGKARSELQNANAARLSLHSSWRAFLVEQVAKWQAYSQQFQNQETALSERVNAARAALDAARSSLAASKSQLQKNDQTEQTEVTTVSDEEEETKESKEAATTSALKITESLQQLGQSLQTLSANADELMIAEQQATKRQRVEPPVPDAETSGAQSFR